MKQKRCLLVLAALCAAGTALVGSDPLTRVPAGIEVSSLHTERSRTIANGEMGTTTVFRPVPRPIGPPANE